MLIPRVFFNCLTTRNWHTLVGGKRQALFIKPIHYSIIACDGTFQRIFVFSMQASLENYPRSVSSLRVFVQALTSRSPLCNPPPYPIFPKLQAATSTGTKNEITLKGSVEIVTEFFGYAINR